MPSGKIKDKVGLFVVGKSVFSVSSTVTTVVEVTPALKACARLFDHNDLRSGRDPLALIDVDFDHRSRHRTLDDRSFEQ